MTMIAWSIIANFFLNGFVVVTRRSPLRRSSNMRSLLPGFILVLLVAVACHEPDEEIGPVTAATQAPISEAMVDDSEPPLNPDTETFEKKNLKGLPYRMLPPRNFDVKKTYPLLVFLHGIGERGTDNEKQLRIGSEYFLRDSIRHNYPAFIVYPQCPGTAYWFDGDIASRVKELIDTLRNRYPIDNNRVWIGGFSMGAYGTFEIVSRYPGFFESAIAIAGDGDASKATLMAKTRWRIFAGQHDDVVPSIKSERIARALQTAGASVSFSLYPQANHNTTWVYAFSEPDLMPWLFQKSSPVAAN